MGHRNSLGLAFNPVTGDLWNNENGPYGGDEINIIKPGANYGWPLVSFGRDYSGPQIVSFSEGMVGPIVFWAPSIAPSGMAFYTGDRFPDWKNNVLVGAMLGGAVQGVGHLERIVFNENWDETARESLLTDMKQRIRDVRQGPDGLVYVLTDEDTRRADPAGTGKVMLRAFRAAALSVLVFLTFAQFGFAQFNDGGRQVAKGLPAPRTADGHIDFSGVYHAPGYGPGDPPIRNGETIARNIARD